ncbi:MAG TPA: PilZ domain-containing protein [Myxococcota bacterium]|nr:PilZ domain-containing protein [Myxococcota bacterium]
MAKDLLLLGANAPDMELLRTRAARLGYRVVPAKTPDQAHALLRVGGTRIGAVIVPSDLPVVDLRSALDALRRLVPAHELTWLAAGRDPGPAGRDRMRKAGVPLALFDPLDTHTLRFQLNRALAGRRLSSARRRTVRAPADRPVGVRVAMRRKEGRLYSVSASGAFVAIDQPSPARSPVALEFSLPDAGLLTLSARVVMTNVPGNLARTSLPWGMGVQFQDIDEGASVALLVYAQERFRTLAV